MNRIADLSLWLMPPWRWVTALAAALLLGIAGLIYVALIRVPITEYSVPQRAERTPTRPAAQTVIVTSVGIPLRKILSGLEQDIPKQLWSIDRQLDNCVPQGSVRVFGRNIPATPSISCTLKGDVRRGPISLTSRDDMLIARFPINASVAVDKIAGFISSDEGTGSAMLELSARFLVSRDWQSEPAVELSYQWVEEPGIEFLGQRIRFTGKADEELQPIVQMIERNLQEQIARLAIKPVVDDLWNEGSRVELLDAKAPQVWLRLEPQQAGIEPFQVADERMFARVMMQADTLIAVGQKPTPPEQTSLGQAVAIAPGSGFNAAIPVLAKYSEVAPAILGALRQLATQGIETDSGDRLAVDFQNVALYPAAGNNMAIGITAEVHPAGWLGGGYGGREQGQIWLTAQPASGRNSATITLKKMRIFGAMEAGSGDLLVDVMNNRQVQQTIERAVAEQFAVSYDAAVGRARSGVLLARLGKSRSRLIIQSVTNGDIQAASTGLYMPVRAIGSAATDGAR